MISIFYDEHVVLYQHAKFWRDRTTGADTKTENLDSETETEAFVNPSETRPRPMP